MREGQEAHGGHAAGQAGSELRAGGGEGRALSELLLSKRIEVYWELVGLKDESDLISTIRQSVYIIYNILCIHMS